MSIRTINYTVSVGGITPASQQFGGTQGDHNAVELKFTIDTELYNSITANTEGTVYYRFDGYDGSGGMKSTEPAPLDDNVCTYGLEEWITRYGGKVQVYLVLTDITDTTEMELYSFPAVLNLKDRPDGHLADGGDYESISTLYEGAKASADKAEKAATRAEQVLDDIGGAIPDIDVTEVSDGVEITITSEEGIETAKVYNGRDGADGKDGKDGEDVDYSLVANALQGTTTGMNAVVLKDISPLLHSVALKLSSKNLIDNRKVFSSGNIYFGVKNYNQYITLPAGTYTFSVVTADGAGTNVYAIYATDNSNINATYGGTSVSFTLAKETNVKFKVYKGSYTSVDDIISAQVEKGTVATAHTAKIDDFSETKFVLTSNVDVNTPMQEVLLDAPAESVRVVVNGGAYCVGGLVPMVDGDDLTASGIKDNLVLWPTWSYGEAPGNYDLVYTVSGNTLSWSGTKYYEFDGVIEQSEDISGSVELSTSGQKIIGFCQIYSLDEDNPNAEYPEWDNLDMTVAIYESTPSVEVKVYGKNLCDFTKFKPYGSGKITLLENGLTYTGNYFIRLDGNILTPNCRYYFNCKFETADNITPVWRLEYADGTYSSGIGNGGGITLTKQVKYILFYPEMTGTVHTSTLTDIQIEQSTAISEYEPYIEPATYTVNGDGTVKGVTSVYPSMTLFSDTDGVELSVEYNRDINKAIAEIQQVIAQLQTLAVATVPMNEEI